MSSSRWALPLPGWPVPTAAGSWPLGTTAIEQNTPSHPDVGTVVLSIMVIAKWEPGGSYFYAAGNYRAFGGSMWNSESHAAMLCVSYLCYTVLSWVLLSSQIAWWIQGSSRWMDLMVKNCPSWLIAGWHLGEGQGGLKLPFAIRGTFGNSWGTWGLLASYSHPGNPRKFFVTMYLLSWFWFCSNTDAGSLLWPLDPTPLPGSLLPAPAVCTGPAATPHPLLVRRGRTSLLDC